MGTLSSVKRSLTLVFGIVLLGVIAYLVFEYRADFGQGGQRNAAKPGMLSAQIAWQIVDRSAEGFKVEMPAGAGETQVPAYTGQGVVEQVEMIEASLDPETTYAVAWADNPPVERVSSGEGAERTLDMARDGALGRTQTTLLSESRDNRNGYPARDFSARNAGGGILNARLILAGTRLYMLIATFPAASVRHDEDVNHFFNSFSLTANSQQ